MTEHKRLHRPASTVIWLALCTGLLTLTQAGYAQALHHSTQHPQIQLVKRLQLQTQMVDDRLIALADGRLNATFTAHQSTPWKLRTDYQIQSLWANDLKTLRLPIPKDDHQLLDLTQTLIDSQQNLTLHRLDRLVLSYTQTYYSVHLGRQAFSWGQGEVFNPLDLFNPFSPTAWDNEYKPGSDMVHLQWLMNSGDDLSLLWVPRRDTSSNKVDANQSSFAAFWRHFASIETHLMLAKDYEDTVLGLSFNGHWRDGQWKIDLMPSWLANGERKTSGLLSYHQAWSWHNRTLSGFIEAFYNGMGETQTGLRVHQLNVALQKRLQRGQLFTQNRHYMSFGVRTEVTPLLSTTLSALQNLDDASQRWLLHAHYALSDYQQLRLGIQIGRGEPTSEFNLSSLGFIQWVNTF